MKLAVCAKGVVSGPRKSGWGMHMGMQFAVCKGGGAQGQGWGCHPRG